MMSKASTIDGRVSKKAKVVEEEWDIDGLADQLFAPDSEDEGGGEDRDEIAFASEEGSDKNLGDDEEPPKELTLDSDEEEPFTLSINKRKSTRIPSPSASKIKSRSTSVLLNDGRMKHNLRDLADRGQGGRVMFVLEKLTKSKMKGEE